MKSKTTIALMITSALFVSMPVTANDMTDLNELKIELLKMRQDYESRIDALENRLANMEQKTVRVETQVNAAKKKTVTAGSSRFNPAISLVLNSQFSDYSRDPEDYQINGFAIPGEGGLAKEGFSLGESELTFSANIDQLLMGQTTIALHDDEGETEVEVEEAFIETLGLGNGLTVRAGRFFSPIGYLNEKHIHAWNFADAPLIYRGLFGNQLVTDGIKVSYLLPTDFYMEVGGTAGNGDQNPGSGQHNGIGDWLIYAKTGGDLGHNSSWQLGSSHWQSSPDDREIGAGHSHGGEAGGESVAFNGDTDISNVSFVYKWAPNGNMRQENIAFLTEYFYLNDEGELSVENELAQYDGKQYGGFVEGIYQFSPHWRTGLRYDYLGSDLSASDTELLDDAGLDYSGFHPKRYGLMLEWLPSEFSRFRAQINHDRASSVHDTQVLFQYTVSLGAHGAHNF
jgi:hypothetical protein